MDEMIKVRPMKNGLGLTEIISGNLEQHFPRSIQLYYFAHYLDNIALDLMPFESTTYTPIIVAQAT